MPKLERPDGVEIHWQGRSEGPLVVFAPYWSGHPAALEVLKDNLAADHRVVSYDARGTGESTRTGPHDAGTLTSDMAAVIAEAGGDAVVFALSDGCNHAIRVAAARPDLVLAVVTTTNSPLGRDSLRESSGSGLVGSDSVVEAFLRMLETDYRGALRTLMASNNAQMTDGEVRERVSAQVDYCPREVALPCVRAWERDEAEAEALAIGDRFWSIHYSNQPWFGLELLDRLRDEFPEGHFVELPDGPITAVELHADLIRGIVAAHI